MCSGVFWGGTLRDLKAAGVQMVLWKQNVISSLWSTDKALEQQIQALPGGSLSTICDKQEFDMTLSKSDVMKMQPACVCACVAKNGQYRFSRELTLMKHLMYRKGKKAFISFHNLTAERIRRGGEQQTKP